MTEPACRLYLITPPVLEPEGFADVLAAALDGGDVACLQLRLKGADDDAVLRAVDRLRPLVQERGVAFLLNDRPDLAAASGCDGVHIGQQDMAYAKARQLVGPRAIVGVTCHDSRHLAMEAAERGADYVAFGAFFPSSTKEPPALAPLEIIEWWNSMMLVPSVAVGGITVDNCRPLVEAGADFLAVSAGVWNHEAGPAAAVAAFNRVI